MKRRGMLKCLPVTAGSAAAGFGSLLANAQNYLAKLFVCMQADGGWDSSRQSPSAATAWKRCAGRRSRRRLVDRIHLVTPRQQVRPIGRVV